MNAKQEDKQLPPDLTCDALWTLEEKGEKPTILDVREQDEWDEGHIEYATHLPLSKVEDEVESIFPDKNELVIACCALGGRSAQAVAKMKNLGYTNVHNLSGGYTGYCAKDEKSEEGEE